jgi:alpha-methylacyl-CoA racemase
MLDGGAPFYDTYRASDGRHVAIGAIEQRFWTDLLRVLDLDADTLPDRTDQDNWPAVREILAARIATRTRDEWAKLAEGTDACLTPVLSPWEAAAHPHNAARGTFVSVGDVVQPAPAPKFARTPPAAPTPPSPTGADTDAVLTELGLTQSEISALRSDQVIS